MREAIPERFGPIKTTVTELFDKCYVVVTETTVAAANATVSIARPHRGDLIQYREFSNMKSLKFDGTEDLIVAKRWISDFGRYFYTYSCPGDL